MRHDIEADVSYLLFRDGAGALKAVALSWVADIATGAQPVTLGGREQFSWHGRVLPLIAPEDGAVQAVCGNTPKSVLVLRRKGVALGLAVKRAVDIIHCEARLARAYEASKTVWHNGLPAALFDPSGLFSQDPVETTDTLPVVAERAFSLASLRSSLRGFFAVPRAPSRVHSR